MKTIRNFSGCSSPGSSVSTHSLTNYRYPIVRYTLWKGSEASACRVRLRYRFSAIASGSCAGWCLPCFPWQLISIKEVSDDFGIRFFRISHDMFTDTLSSLWRARPGFFFLRTHIASEPREEYVGRFLNFCDLLAYRAENAPVICRRESVMQLLRVFYWDVYTIYLNDPQAEKTAYTHKEELAFRFMRTVVEEHSPNRDVAYFAERLGITPKYLTNLMNEISGQSARDWIVYFTIFRDQGAARESAMDLKTIVARVNFPRPVYPEPLFPQVYGHVPVSIPEEYSFLNDRLGRKPGFFFVGCEG